jgi:hypothetical protein
MLGWHANTVKQTDALFPPRDACDRYREVLASREELPLLPTNLLWVEFGLAVVYSDGLHAGKAVLIRTRFLRDASGGIIDS